MNAATPQLYALHCIQDNLLVEAGQVQSFGQGGMSDLSAMAIGCLLYSASKGMSRRLPPWLLLESAMATTSTTQVHICTVHFVQS